MSQYPPCLILRHGETEWNRARRLQGGLDSPLTERGQAHARAQGRILRRFGTDGFAWFSSPQGRAWATAQIAAGPGVEITPEPHLAEITMGEWTGLARDAIAAQNPALFETDGLSWYDHAPGGEGLEALAARTCAVLEGLTGPSILVTHGITSRMLRCYLQGLPPEAFETVGGGQGVVYHLESGVQTLLTEEG